MRTRQETKKSYYAKLQTKQVCQIRKKNKTAKNVNLLEFESEENYSLSFISSVHSIHNDARLSPEQFDKAAHDSMLEMLSIDPEYFYQVSTSNELA